MVFDPITYQKTGGMDYTDYPVGSVILSASENVGPQWLRCDGSYINESQYPELTTALGKHSPGVSEAFKAGDGSAYGGSFSTSVLHGGYVWVYSFQNSLLLGWPVSGDPVLEIPLTGTFEFLEAPEIPVVLSICGGKIFLAQKTESQRLKLFAGTFSMAASAIPMTQIQADEIISAAAGTANLVNGFPEVVEAKDYLLDEVEQDCFALCLGESNTAPHNIFILMFPALDFANPVCVQEPQLENKVNDYVYRVAKSLKSFSRKNAGELFYIYCQEYNGNSVIPQPLSLWKGTFSSTPDKGRLILNEQSEISVPPLVTSQHYIYNVQLTGGQIVLRAGNVGDNDFTLFPSGGETVNGVALSPYASLFAGSLAYAASHGLYLIFVGTGVLFSHTPLNMDSWGYLDTTQYFGTITQWGCAEFDTDSNTLCLSGRDSYGEYVCGLLRFHARFDYSNDGAWLPYIASSGVPAWIKAKPGGEA